MAFSKPDGHSIWCIFETGNSNYQWSFNLVTI